MLTLDSRIDLLNITDSRSDEEEEEVDDSDSDSDYQIGIIIM